jgi:UDP-N-acetylglucosamine 4,6-dehydratase
MRILDLVEAVAPGCKVEFIGMRPGEKLHEVLIAEEECRQVVELEDMFVLEPIYPSWAFRSREGGKRASAGFRYSSDTNTWWLSSAEMGELARE